MPISTHTTKCQSQHTPRNANLNTHTNKGHACSHTLTATTAPKAASSPRFARAAALTARHNHACQSSVRPAAAARSLMNELTSAISFFIARLLLNLKFLVLLATFVPSLISPLQCPVRKVSFAPQTSLSHRLVHSAASAPQTLPFLRPVQLMSTPHQVREDVAI
jgi:hypothetical protein